MTAPESHPHNFGRYCKNGCNNYHVVSGDSACGVTGTRLTTTRMTTIYEVGCASYNTNTTSHSSGTNTKMLEAKRLFLGEIAVRVRHEFTQDDNDEYYLCAEDFENVLDELTQELMDETEKLQQEE